MLRPTHAPRTQLPPKHGTHPQPVVLRYRSVAAATRRGGLLQAANHLVHGRQPGRNSTGNLGAPYFEGRRSFLPDRLRANGGALRPPPIPLHHAGKMLERPAVGGHAIWRGRAASPVRRLCRKRGSRSSSSHPAGLWLPGGGRRFPLPVGSGPPAPARSICLPAAIACRPLWSLRWRRSCWPSAVRPGILVTFPHYLAFYQMTGEIG